MATIRIPARSKYNVDRSPAGKLARTYKGVVYDSLAEARYATALDLQKRTGVILDWERQCKCPLVVNGVKVCEMRLDFLVRFKDGRIEYHDVKGAVTAEWNLKRKLFEAITGKKIVVVPAWGK